jgi:predicted amidohydrolase YtcJ
MMKRIIADAWRAANLPVERVVVDIEGERITRVTPAKDSSPSQGDLFFGRPALLMPAFHDSHAHLLTGGLALIRVSLTGVQDVDEAASRLEEAAQNSDGRWMDCYGWDESAFPLNRCLLDRIVPDIPVFIFSHSLHAAAVNSIVFQQAGINEDAPNPPRGRFGRDADGKLNGLLHEDAIDFVARSRPPIEKSQAHSAMLKAQSLAFSLGITSISCSVRRELLPFYFDFAESSDAKIRLNLWRVAADFDYETERFNRREGTRFRLATFKGFVDGALGSQTAALWEPYSNNPANSGILSATKEELSAFIERAAGDGFQVALHAIGDRACTTTLDAYETANCFDSRMRLEHAQILRQEDIGRFGQLGVIASMQPIHCTADMKWAEERIGAKRSRLSYAWRSVKDAGARLCFGSDWPVETLNPLAGIHAAVTRQDTEGNPPGGWIPEQRVSAEEALTAYTEAGAYAAFWEKEVGTISEGKLADLIILSCNPLDCEPRELLNAKVLMTMCGGEIVYRDSSF